MDVLKNAELRRKFLQKFPNNNELAEQLGMYASDLSAWKKGSKNFGELRLLRIEKFIDGTE